MQKEANLGWPESWGRPRGAQGFGVPGPGNFWAGICLGSPKCQGFVRIEDGIFCVPVCEIHSRNSRRNWRGQGRPGCPHRTARVWEKRLAKNWAASCAFPGANGLSLHRKVFWCVFDTLGGHWHQYTWPANLSGLPPKPRSQLRNRST